MKESRKRAQFFVVIESREYSTNNLDALDI